MIRKGRALVGSSPAMRRPTWPVPSTSTRSVICCCDQAPRSAARQTMRPGVVSRKTPRNAERLRRRVGTAKPTAASTSAAVAW